jgi:hypothetical protein
MCSTLQIKTLAAMEEPAGHFENAFDFESIKSRASKSMSVSGQVPIEPSVTRLLRAEIAPTASLSESVPNSDEVPAVGPLLLFIAKPVLAVIPDDMGAFVARSAVAARVMEEATGVKSLA